MPVTKRRNDIRTKYDRIAPSYDAWDAIPERLYYRLWRRRLWGNAPPGRILDVGAGTGKNIDFYPPGAQVAVVDISPRMLAQAAARACARQDVAASPFVMDIRALAFHDSLFDTVVGSFILMVVPDPVKALEEIRRVCKPGGRLLLLEFTRSHNRSLACLQALLSGFTRLAYGARLNRDIVALVQRSGFKIIIVEKVAWGMVRIIQATPLDEAATPQQYQQAAELSVTWTT
ncbi:MAG: methyltransferase domain-containing protein [Chloroflexi bacterium]|nr:methyltransferase domain-containing protein [Chloroflexota bacterium]